MGHFLFGLFPELLVAASGAALHHIYERTRTFLKKRAFEKKYPISGDYITRYEDEIEGSKQIVTALARLKQAGKNVRGQTTFDDRTWILDGLLSEDGYYHGLYYAESKYDRGTGNFFLEIETERTMKGLWSGYDSANQTIAGGSYTFTKVSNPDIEVASKDVLPKLLRIGELTLGDCYLQESDLTSSSGITYYARETNDVVGFACCRIEDTSEYLSMHPKIAERRNKAISATEHIGLLASVAVKDGRQGQGIGSALVRQCLHWLSSKNVVVVLMTAWKSSTGIHINGIARKAGFEDLFEIPDYWAEDSVQNNYRCPACGDPPCHCSAVVFMKHFST